MLEKLHPQHWLSRHSSGFVLALHEIPPQRLEEFLEIIRPAQAVHLSELLDRSKRDQSTAGLFAITVDDGVGDNVRALTTLFLSKNLPATFYLPTQYLDTQEPMMFQWWRRIEPLLPHRKLRLESGTILDLSTPDAIPNLSKTIQRLWYTKRIEFYLPLTRELIEIVLQEHGMTKDALRPAAPISWAEVAALSKNDLIRFESHGVSHIAMSALTEDELVSEMKRSRNRITERTGRLCRHLAYPFGGPESIGPLPVAIGRRFYDSAVTMTLGHVDSANPWLLPRIPLYAENSLWTGGLKIFLKCNALSPLKSHAA